MLSQVYVTPGAARHVNSLGFAIELPEELIFLKYCSHELVFHELLFINTWTDSMK